MNRYDLTILRESIKTLAGLSSTLRHVERFAGGYSRSAHEARVVAVRQQCRAAQLAYAFLRDKTYNATEGKCHDAPDWSLVREFIERHAEVPDTTYMQRYAEWMDAATLLADNLRDKHLDPVAS